METNNIILGFVLIPFIGFFASLFFPEKKESAISWVAILTTALQLFLVIGFTINWLIKGTPKTNIEEITLYSSNEYKFLIDFYFDKTTVTYLLVGSFITFLITRYSQYYMHLENGYKRFFNTVLFFFLGYNWTVISGNFETLFMGWEMLGISSFLLIAFYRERYLPVRNAVKVFTVYRIGDVGILAAMWASHHLWHENINFVKLSNYELVHEHLMSHSEIGIFIGISLLVAAAAKSAQIPFSSWLPRAMEGPTPSSAIFYGSLSVHFGVFLLLRTYPFWEQQMSVKILIALTGLLTAIISFFITRVQYSIKPQIAYSSITQIGIIFIEVAFGFHVLALIHFAGNAFLRTYQLLISPSTVSYMIRDQHYNFHPVENPKTNKIINTLYILSIREWNMDSFMNRKIFNPLKNIGKSLNFLSPKNVFYYFFPFYLLGLFLFFNQEYIPKDMYEYIPFTYALSGLIMVLKSFSERLHPRLAWILILFNHFSLVLAVSFNEHFEFRETLIFLSGVSVAGIIGYLSLARLKKLEPDYFDLNEYYGHISRYPVLGFVFLIAMLGLTGFPISPSFIGEDLLFSHIKENQFFLGMFTALSFIISGIALIRIYARLFLGPHPNPMKSNPLKSS
ncbi:MAG: proton-conducting transporter membrane subunit [Spirosomataceae bacterium]